MPLVHEVPAEIRELVVDWLGRFAVVHPYHATATAVRSGQASVVREYAEALAGFSPAVIQNAAIDLRNEGEHFPSIAEWRQACRQSTRTIGRAAAPASAGADLPAWMQERIALQTRRCQVMLAAARAHDATPVQQRQLLERVTRRLLREWDADPELVPLARDFTQYREIPDEVLHAWVEWAIPVLAAESAARRAGASEASNLRTAQDVTTEGNA